MDSSPSLMTRKQSMKRRHSAPPPLGKFKRSPSVGDVMVLMFWDSDGIILMGYLQRGYTINGDYCANVLAKLRELIKENSMGKLRRGVMLLNHNFQIHTIKVTVEAAIRCSFKILPQPHYSLDLVPFYCYQFPKLKEKLGGKKYLDDIEVIEAGEGCRTNVAIWEGY